MGAIRHPRDFWAGVLFILLGGGACVIALGYSPGSASRMGPGYFPRAIGLMLVTLGAVLILRSFRSRGEPVSLGSFKPLLIVLGSVLLFGLTIMHVGLVAATIMVVLVSSTASFDYRRIESTVAAIALAGFVVVAFRYGLELQLPTWPPSLVG
jgi:Tripartite tricarboxylate transporter TctB family